MEGNFESAISFFKNQVAQLLAPVTGLSLEQLDTLIEERFDEKHEFSVTMPKIRKYKIPGDPAEVAQEWKSKVNIYFTNFFYLILNLLLSDRS